jgi:V8-like Glu-specific endopeptidase
MGFLGYRNYLALALLLTANVAIAEPTRPLTGVHNKSDQKAQIRRLRREGILHIYDLSKKISLKENRPRALVLRELVINSNKPQTQVADHALLLTPEQEKTFSENARRIFTSLRPAKVGRVWHPKEITGPDKFRDTVLLTGNNTVCTGTLISPNHLITAAHCYCDKAYNVTVGRTSLQYDYLRSIVSQKSATHIACDLLTPESRFGQNIFKGDLALYTLSSPATGLSFRKIASEKTLRRAASLVAVGFGRTSNNDDTVGKKLLSPPLVITSYDCTEPQKGIFCQPGQEMKAGGFEGDTCQGDSGGPVYVANEAGTLYLAGVTSRSADGTAKCGKGGIYVKLTSSDFQDWLKSKGVPSDVFDQ